MAGIDTFEPVRDPRTAFGNMQRREEMRRARIPVGQVIEGPPDAAQPAARPTAPTPTAPAAPAGRLASAGGAMRAAGPALGAAAVGVPEALGIGKVLANPNTSKMDVATQTAEGIGRTAAAGAGALGGAALGAPLGPVGAAVGGIIGGGIGYLSADQAIKGGRALAGVDPASPVDRLPAAAPAQMAGAAQQPFSDARQGPAVPSDITSPAAPTAVAPAQPAAQIGAQAAANAPTNAPADVRGITERASAIEAKNSQLRSELDAYGPGVSGGGMTGFGIDPAKAAREANFDRNTLAYNLRNNPRESVQLAGQPMPFDVQQARQQQAELTTRGQDIGLASQQLQAGSQAALETQRGRNQRDIADLQSKTQRDVANIGATARTSAAESAANARAAAAEATARRFIPVPGGQTVENVGGMPTTVKAPDRVFDAQSGKFVDAQPAQAAASAVTPKAEYDKMPKGARYTGPDGKTYIKG